MLKSAKSSCGETFAQNFLLDTLREMNNGNNSEVYPRHKTIVDKYIAKGEVIGIGPFADMGNMAIFRTRTAAEEFVKEDPFILEGLVRSFVIRELNDTIL